MNKVKNVPSVVRLNDEDVFHLSILRSWLDIFPAKLREHARFKVHHLHRAIQAREISAYSLLSGAYIGFAPLPVSHRRFINEAGRINKLEFNPPEFLTNEVARESSAAEDFGMSHGELKRLFAHLGDLAVKSAGITSYAAIFHCRNEILNDRSPHAPARRETYAKGPLHLWDFAKAVDEHNFDDMAFGTFDDWILFLHLEDGVVAGHAIYASAHRFGNFSENPLIDGFELRMRGHNILSPIIDVPREVQEAVKALAEDRFRDRPFEFIPPPMIWNGVVVPSKMICPDVRRTWTEA